MRVPCLLGLGMALPSLLAVTGAYAFTCKVESVAPLALELGPAEAREKYTGIQARVRVGSEPTAQPAMDSCAKDLFEGQLHRDAEKNAGFNIVFVTFLLGDKVVNGQTVTETYRTGFMKSAGEWRPIARGARL